MMNYWNMPVLPYLLEQLYTQLYFLYLLGYRNVCSFHFF